MVHRVGEEAPDPPRSAPERVGVDETAITVGPQQCWVYAAIDVDTKILLGVHVSRWLAAYAFYYNYQRPNQALSNRTLVEEATNR